MALKDKDFEKRPHYYFINTYIFIVKLHLLFLKLFVLKLKKVRIVYAT